MYCFTLLTRLGFSIKKYLCRANFKTCTHTCSCSHCYLKFSIIYVAINTLYQAISNQLIQISAVCMSCESSTLNTISKCEMLNLTVLTALMGMLIIMVYHYCVNQSTIFMFPQTVRKLLWLHRHGLYCNRTKMVW